MKCRSVDGAHGRVLLGLGGFVSLLASVYFWPKTFDSVRIVKAERLSSVEMSPTHADTAAAATTTSSGGGGGSSSSGLFGCYPSEDGWDDNNPLLTQETDNNPQNNKHQNSTDLFLGSATSESRTASCAKMVKFEQTTTRSKRLESKPNPDPLVAVCMVGNARTLQIPAVYKRVKRNLLEAISRRTILFANLKTDDAPLKQQPKHGGFRSIHTRPSLILEAVRVLRPVWAKIRKNVDLTKLKNDKCTLTTEGAERRKEPDFYVKPENERRFLLQMHAMHECYQAVLDFEKAANVTFDAIAKIRPDVVWFYPSYSALELIYGRKAAVTHLTDQFIFAPRRFSDGFSRWWQNYTHCSGEWSGAYFPEKAFEESFQELGAVYTEDRKTPQAIRRASRREPSAGIACGRQRRIRRVEECFDLVYGVDDQFVDDG